MKNKKKREKKEKKEMKNCERKSGKHKLRQQM